MKEQTYQTLRTVLECNNKSIETKKNYISLIHINMRAHSTERNITLIVVLHLIIRLRYLNADHESHRQGGPNHEIAVFFFYSIKKKVTFQNTNNMLL